jgi:hypothetical protein
MYDAGRGRRSNFSEAKKISGIKPKFELRKANFPIPVLPEERRPNGSAAFPAKQCAGRRRSGHIASGDQDRYLDFPLVPLR